MDRAGTATPIVEPAGRYSHLHLSPDGKWLAFTADDSGRSEIYVQSFPSGGSRRQISTDGGVRPLWSHDGREIFYRGRQGQMLAVAVTTEPVFEAGEPRLVFKEPTTGRYDLAPDGERFLVERQR